MIIKFLNNSEYEIFEMRFPLLDIEISDRRKTYIRSIAFKYHFLTSTTIRKNHEGISYLELKNNKIYDNIVDERVMIRKLIVALTNGLLLKLM